MTRIAQLCLVVAAMLLLSGITLAQDRFDRAVVIDADTLDIGGYGNVVAGVDFDGDGLTEIYAVNSDWHDQLGYDLVPRIYKYEVDANGEWNTVWSTSLDIDFQNTWPALAAADLDQDGRSEIVWGPVNNFGGGLNNFPPRVVVYESAGDGSDVMGIDNGDGTYRPNSQWGVTDVSGFNLRPFRWHVTDIDSDGTDEVVAGCRAGDGVQIYSVDNIPDTGDSTETWTIEFSGVSGTFYDIAVIGNAAYAIQDNGNVTKVSYDATGDSFVVSAPQVGLAGGGSWNSAQTVDVDGDQVEEIILASWSSSTSNVYLLQQSGDSLISTIIKDVPNTSNRLYGGASGDMDNDGLLDFAFGTRQSSPNGLIHRLEYQGGAIDQEANWELSTVDQGVSGAQQYDIMTMADVDGDNESELIYTGTPRGLSAADPPQPIVILDRIPFNQPIINAVADVPNDQGRQVWVIWQGSGNDVTPSTGGVAPIALINGAQSQFPFNEINGQMLSFVETSNAQEEGLDDITKYTIWRVDAGQYPVQVGETTPIQSQYYAAVVPTLGDEDPATYFVTAHTATPTLNWQSLEKSGSSVDNLIPTAPANVTTAANNGAIDLAWDESVDEDFDYFEIVRSDQSGFDPATASVIGTTTATAFTDDNVAGTDTWYYRVVAYDFTGNRGVYSVEVFATVTGIDDNAITPKEFALKQNYPNPFNPETRIAFDLPRASDVQLTIYNIRGQEVRALVRDSRQAGSHTVVWDGRDNRGSKVASGTYIYLIKAGDYTKTLKMTLLK